MSLLRRRVLWDYEGLCRELGVEPRGDEALRRLGVEAVVLSATQCPSGALYIPSAEGSDTPEQAMFALSSGAAATLTSHPIEAFPAGTPAIVVQNPAMALARLAHAARERLSGPVIGITGSVGKSTTVAMAAHILAYEGSCQRTVGNQNLLGGIMQTLASTPADADHTVLEIATHSPGTVARSAELARPEVAVFTNIGLSHAENFEHPRDVLLDKASLFDHLRGPKVAIISRSVLEADVDGVLLGKLFDRLITVGYSDADTVQITDVQAGPLESDFRLRIEGRTYELTLPMPGAHLAENAACAVAAAYALGVDPGVASARFLNMAPVSRRCERLRLEIKSATVEVIDDAWNASPKSFDALLDLLRVRSPRRKILVAGDILELGEHAVEQHRLLGEKIAGAGIDLLVTVGPLAAEMAALGGVETIRVDDAEEAGRRLKPMLKDGDLLALKASHSVKLRRALGIIAPLAKQRPRALLGWTIETEFPSGSQPGIPTRVPNQP